MKPIYADISWIICGIVLVTVGGFPLVYIPLNPHILAMKDATTPGYFTVFCAWMALTASVCVGIDMIIVSTRNIWCARREDETDEYTHS